MKRIIALILALVMVVSVCFALSSCDFGKNDDDKTDKTEETEKTKKKDKKKDKDKKETETESADKTEEETETESESETETETEAPIPVLGGDIVGKWSAFIEGKKIMSMDTDESDENYDLIMGVDYEGGMNIIFAFNSDGSCDMTLDEDSVREFYNQNLEKFLEASLAASDLDMTVEEYFEIAQTTREEMVEEMMDQMELSISSGNSAYSLDGDVLTVDGSEFAIDLDADKLVIKEQVGGEDAGDFLALLPLTMDRIG